MLFRSADAKREALEAAAAAAIEKFEALAKAEPDRYRRRVLATAAAGYAAPFLFLVTLIAAVALLGLAAANSHSGGGAVAKLGIGVAILGFMIVRAMIVKFPPPEGIRIAEADAPALFGEIEKVRAALKGPPLHEVYLDDNLNAAIQQSPRFGFFGGHINRLIIGLPLMNALTTPQLIAVIAHEYGHLAGSHGKTSSDIYRTRAMWSRLYEQLHGHQGILTLPLTLFIDRFAPYFDRLSFPLARANEFEADRAAADIAGAQVMGDALMRINLASRRLRQEFWPSIQRRTAAAPSPDIDPQAAMAEDLRAMSAWTDNKRWARAALLEETSFEDTHPALKDRLAAVGAKPRLPSGDAEPSIALLGPFAAKATAEFDTKWRAVAGRNWTNAHEEAKGKIARLEELDARAAAGPLNADEALERAHLAEETRSRQEASTRLLDAVKWNPGNAQSWLEAGAALVEIGDARGLKFLSRAGAMEDRLKLFAHNNAWRYHAERGDRKAAAVELDAAKKEGKRHQKAMMDTSAFSKKDDLAPHGLIEPAGDLARALGSIPGVRNAWLVRKSTDSFPGYFAYHLIVEPKREKFDYGAAIAAFQSIGLDAPGYIWFAVRENKWMAKKARRADGAALVDNGRVTCAAPAVRAA